MRVALAEASVAFDNDEVPVGAAVVIDGVVVATGNNRCIADSDPSAHAEIVALRAACAAKRNYRLSGATLYVSLEPCIMCTGAIVQARVRRVVFAAYDKKAGALGSVEDLSLSKAANHRFEINGGLFADESQRLLERFFSTRR